MFVLKGNLACAIFLPKCDVVIGNLVVYARNRLPCVTFPSPCNVIIGNVYVFVIE